MDKPQYLVGEELLTSVAMEIGHTGREDLQEKLIVILNAGPVQRLDMSDEEMLRVYQEKIKCAFPIWKGCWQYLREQMKGKV